jgi:hypothetical protein
VLGAEDLQNPGWFDLQAIPLRGRGLTPVAYRMHWAGKTVLLSGRIPVKLGTPTAEQLLQDVAGEGSIDKYLDSLDRLAKAKPDLWLPAVPVHGQNANLYDDDWEKVLVQNRHVFQ